LAMRRVLNPLNSSSLALSHECTFGSRIDTPSMAHPL
jgi:hypothetical protein